MKKIIVSLTIILTGGVLFTTALPQNVAATDDTTCTSSFLTFPAWYDGLLDSNCNIASPGDNLSGFIWHVVLNLVEIAIMGVGYIATGMVLYGGFLYITSLGASEDLVKARKTILNAVIGLVISIGAIAIVNFISSIIP